MRLELLKIQGFKSFADKVELVFQPGLTAIVGPNGCGKSNITDAIRWVLGEQSVKSLRGNQMEDVIFNGSTCRKATGMAEVSLKFANLGSLSLPYQEVVISRRIFRSGESEYAINKNPCRLKDITDLFLDTGIGKGAYSIIEQGKVDFIINAKPKDRRLLIESAAGIMKYKARKEDALKKIEATQNNLERLDDILREVERQKESLAKQAERAKEYKEYKRQEEYLVRTIATSQYLSLYQNHQKMEKDYSQWRDKQIELQTEVTRHEVELETLKSSLLEDDEHISLLQKSIYSQDSQLATLKQKQQVWAGEREHLQEEEAHIRLEMEELQTSQQRTEDEIINGEKHYREQESLLLEKRSDLSLLEKDWSLLQVSLKEKHRLQETFRKDLGGLSNQETRLEHFCETLKEKQREISGKEGGLEKVLTRLGGEIEKKRLDQQRLQEKITQQKELLEDWQEQESILDLEMKSTSGELKNMEGEIREVDHQLQAASSRLQSLEEIFERKEGYQESVRRLLMAKRENKEGFQELHGVIAELISVPPEYEKAIEAILQHHLQSMVVNTYEDGFRLLTYLRQHKIGQATLFALQGRCPTLGRRGDEVICSQKISGVIGTALEVIKAESRYAQLMDYFFGHTLIVESLDQARQIMNGSSGWHQIVTLPGELITSSGLVFGGEGKGLSVNFLARKRQIEELRVSVLDFKERKNQKDSARQKILGHLEEMRKKKEDLRQRIHELEIVQNGLGRDQSHFQREIEREAQQIEEMQYRKGRLKADLEELAKDLKREEERLQSVRLERTTKEQSLQALLSEMDTLTHQEKDFQEKITQAKITITSLTEHQKSLQMNLIRSKEDRANNAKKTNTFQQRLEKIAQILEENEQKINSLKVQIPQLEKEREETIVNLNQAEVLRQERMEMVKSLERKTKKIHHDCGQATVKMQEIELTLTESRVRMQHILENAHLTLEEIALTEPETQPKDYQAEKLEDQLDQIKEKLAALGTVNLMAIDEYEQLLERYTFLKSQKEDMSQSLSSLEVLINKINQDSSERFKKTFEIVNNNFQSIFHRLFNGGHAELLLEQPDDYLETGIEVVVQPPGKKPQYLSLLSGGEKAMTAIALIFAIYLLKPSPFCLLDEVDAPLDDANTDRFINIINEFKERTQFLLITHSKKTMQMADIIYGVTMEQPGLSKVVSLELKK